MSFLDLEHEIRNSLTEHRKICDLIEDLDSNDPTYESRRQKYVEEALALKERVEIIYEQQIKVAAEEEALYLSENTELEDKEQTKDKLQFLRALNLQPRTSADEPANRKSRRNRMPATKLVTYTTEPKPSPPKKRLLRKRPVEEPRPSSTPSISASLPQRFITESSVICEMCRKTFKVHHVSSLDISEPTSKHICLACQVAVDTQELINTIIEQTPLPKPGSLSVSTTVQTCSPKEEVPNPLQTMSRASSPGFSCD